MTDKEHFIDIVRTNIHRDGIEHIMEWLEESDFYEAPASTRFHDNFKGGLCRHSINVYYHLWHLNRAYNTNFSTESITIVSLFHDLCKVNCYTIEKRWRKDDNQKWEQYETYKWDEREKYGGHGAKSVFLVQRYMPLSFDEAAAIQSHMGVENGNCNAILDAYRVNSLAFLLHVADMASTIDDLNAKLGIATPIE